MYSIGLKNLSSKKKKHTHTYKRWKQTGRSDKFHFPLHLLETSSLLWRSDSTPSPPLHSPMNVTFKNCRRLCLTVVTEHISATRKTPYPSHAKATVTFCRAFLRSPEFDVKLTWFKVIVALSLQLKSLHCRVCVSNGGWTLHTFTVRPHTNHLRWTSGPPESLWSIQDSERVEGVWHHHFCWLQKCHSVNLTPIICSLHFFLFTSARLYSSTQLSFFC